MQNRNINKDQAVLHIINTEKNRSDFRKSVKGKKVVCEDFDLSFNQSKFIDNEIIDIIYDTLIIKKIINIFPIRPK